MPSNVHRLRSDRGWPARGGPFATNLRASLAAFLKTDPSPAREEHVMKPDEDDWDEALFLSFLNSTNQEMPPPDAEFLARLRDRSTNEFVDAAAQQSEPVRESRGEPVSSLPSSPKK